MDKDTYYSLKTIINVRKRYVINNLEGNLYYQNALAKRQDLVDKVYEIARSEERRVGKECAA